MSPEPEFMRNLFALLFFFSMASVAEMPPLPESFDSLGPTVQSLKMGDRTLHYIDDGAGDIPVLFIGGLGTSVRVIRLLDFMESYRSELGLRFISIERNGMGQTALDTSLTIADFVKDAEYVLDHLGIDRFAVFGISGGGVYSGHVVPYFGDRVTSIHLAVTAPTLANPNSCLAESAASGYAAVFAEPMKYFYLDDRKVTSVPGLQDTAFDEAARAANMRGQRGDASAVLHEIQRFCEEPVSVSESVTAPLYVYLGAEDSITKAVPVNAWMTTFPNSPGTLRLYAGEGHTVQYRHLEQILLDIAGYGYKIVVCENGKSVMVEHESGLQPENAGLCAWHNL